jgi:sulfatase maturation enzyme AslB (radical SAM superfamily)
MIPFDHLLVTGGEPTLRQDLAEIIDIFIKTPAQTITMPTNGMLPEKINALVLEILNRHPENRILIGISLDGPREIHDKLRGPRGSFDNALKTLSLLGNLRHKYKNLRLTTLTVIHEQNVARIFEFIDTIARDLPVDYISIEPIRGSPQDPDLRPAGAPLLRSIQAKVLEKNLELLSRSSPEDALEILSYHIETYKLQLYALENQKMNFHCQAGEKVGVLEPDGELRICELFDTIGNVRDHDYSFRKVWHNRKAEEQRKRIASGACWCTHCINLGHSIPFLPELSEKRIKTKNFLEQNVKTGMKIDFMKLLETSS